MKHKTSVSAASVQAQYIPQTDRYLVEAANVLLANYKNPADFLLFLADCQEWACVSLREVKDYRELNASHHYSLNILTKELIPVWFSSPDNPTKLLSKALHNVDDYIGGSGLNDLIVQILIGFSYEIIGGGISEDYLARTITGITVLKQIASILHRDGSDEWLNSFKTKAA